MKTKRSLKAENLMLKAENNLLKHQLDMMENTLISTKAKLDTSNELCNKISSELLKRICKDIEKKGEPEK